MRATTTNTNKETTMDMNNRLGSLRCPRGTTPTGHQLQAATARELRCWLHVHDNEGLGDLDDLRAAAALLKASLDAPDTDEWAGLQFELGL